MAAARQSTQRGSESQPERVRRMPRAQRREQLLDAATRAFARTGFTATGLDDVAAEAGVTHVILYRHFASKNDLYRAVLDRASPDSATPSGPRPTTRAASRRCCVPPRPTRKGSGCCSATRSGSRSSAT
jgi:hypothetical protein